MTYREGIALAAREIEQADAVVLGAGAGLSTAAGFRYDGERFEENFRDFADHYGITDMYTGGFYPFETPEEFWAFWSRHIYVNLYDAQAGGVYKDLYKILKDKNYFTITTNVDEQFEKAGFPEERIFEVQGLYRNFQCSVPCTQETYDNEDILRRMYAEQKDMKIPSELVPVCPRCGSPLTTHLRVDNRFVEDERWHASAERYEAFLRKGENKREVFLEIGVGYNTPGIIKYAFWQLAIRNPNAFYIAISLEDSQVPRQLDGRALGIRADAAKAVADIIEERRIESPQEGTPQ